MKEIYVLADSYEREIVLTSYNSHKEAYDKMKSELDYVLGFDSKDVDTANKYGYVCGEDYDINDWSAWSNVKDQQNDWVIEKIIV